MATASGQRDFAGFPAIRAIVKTVHAKAHVVLALADSAVPFTRAALFRQVALCAIGWTLHKGLCGKLYMSVRGCGKAKVKSVRESLTPLAGERLARGGLL